MSAMTDPNPPVAHSPLRPRGLVGRLFDLFSSVRLGIVLLVLLFIYMSVGSAGLLYPTHPNIFHPAAWVHAQIRQWRPFEMTEFEWFHWWPFDLLIGLIGLNIVVTTLRRIRFRPVNYGVWMIHTGVLVTIVGCFIYFGTKVEGDSPVPRRMVIAETVETGPDGTATVVDRARFVASPGQRVTVGRGDRRYDLEVIAIDPEWELRSAEAEGKRAYSVNVQVRPLGRSDAGPGSRMDGVPFIRQLLAGFPEHTEDVLPAAHASSETPGPRFVRAVRELGRPLVDESIRLSLDYAPQEWLYLRPELEKCFALYLRRPGETEWAMRPMPGMPLYNDRVASREQVFVGPGEDEPPISPIDLPIPPASPDDPLPDVTFHATGYLRYALERSRYNPGGPSAPFNPVAWVTLIGADGQASEARLEALDPRMNKADGGLLQFRAVADEAAFARLVKAPALAFRIPALGIEVREPIAEASLGNPDAPYRPIVGQDGAESGYAYRVVAVQDDLALSSGVASVAIVEVRTPSQDLRRWVFDDPALTRDVTEEILRNPNPTGPRLLDDSIEVAYEPGHGLSLVLLVAGPDPNQLRVLTALGEGDATAHPITPRQPFRLPAGIALNVGEYMPRAVQETKPFIVPPAQRSRDAGVQFSNARIEVPGGGSLWLPYHHFVFDSDVDVLRRHRYQPSLVTLPDGRRVEVLFSRERRKLPVPVALEEFVLATHVGGFTGETATIRDYKSYVRFKKPDGTWDEPTALSVNRPVEHGGYSFFQAQWDPPDQARFEGDRASLGLNYTVLGVGNRHGVNVMLWGTIIACIGMVYAFYIKPIIKRRQREAVQAELERSRSGAARQSTGSPRAALATAPTRGSR